MYTLEELGYKAKPNADSIDTLINAWVYYIIIYYYKKTILGGKLVQLQVSIEDLSIVFLWFCLFLKKARTNFQTVFLSYVWVSMHACNQCC